MTSTALILLISSAAALVAWGVNRLLWPAPKPNRRLNSAARSAVKRGALF